MDPKTSLRGIVRCKLLKKKKTVQGMKNDNEHNFYLRQL